ncbi:hypothetical protein H9I45_15175 [Polaribacter haliotis]|uniref:Uncharacterized protein n=1 Tax=Polaribacter haliotis TaxID=1888915 RepID=A0A7L8AF80_9FLAO|nr:hypothetical protein [Polaribacter haliotis]QOD60661.1 hypothetical protein H9I45_15175 [Polaribacter haliotis]
MAKSKEVKLSKLIALFEELKLIMLDVTNGELRFEIYELLGELKDKVENFNNTKNDLVKQFGEEVEKGNYEVKEDKLKDFYEALNPILAKEYVLNNTINKELLKKLESKHPLLVYEFVK